MPTMPCYHVTTNSGEVYGAAAPNATDARAMVAARLRDEGSDDWPARAARVGMWTTPYGTVLHY